MKCYHTGCNVRTEDGGSLFRQNIKGQIAIWACREHNKNLIDPVVDEIVSLVEKDNTKMTGEWLYSQYNTARTMINNTVPDWGALSQDDQLVWNTLAGMLIKSGLGVL